jgi:hypothetical protein
MLKVDFIESKGIAILEPNGELSSVDFEKAAKTIDPYIEKFGKLNGLVIHTKSFPGWDSFASFITHMKFVKEHHKKVSRIAFVTDSPIGTIAEHITSHFINAEIKHFGFDEIEASKHWIEFGEAQ